MIVTVETLNYIFFIIAIYSELVLLCIMSYVDNSKLKAQKNTTSRVLLLFQVISCLVQTNGAVGGYTW